MELRHLRYFVTVAEEQNVSRAAARLFVSQPAISKQLKDLEAELGVELFTRTSSGIQLTHAGEAFLVDAREILRRAAQAVSSMQAFRKNAPQQKLRIGYIPTALPSFLTRALREYAATHPHVEVELRELAPLQQIEALDAGELDIAFVGNACPALRDQYQVRAVKRIPLEMALASGHALSRRKTVDLDEFSGENFIGFDEKRFPGRNQLICDLCVEAGFTPPLEPRADSLASVLTLVAAGRGVALMPQDVASLPHPDVVFVGLERPRAFVDSSAVWKAGLPAESPVAGLLEVLEGS